MADERVARVVALASTLFLVALPAWAPTASAQARTPGPPPAATSGRAIGGVRYLPIGHPAELWIERLRLRGALPGLSPLARPYRRSEIAAALARTDTTALSPVERAWLREVRYSAFGTRYPVAAAGASSPKTEDRTPKTDFGLTLAAGARGATTPRLDPLRPYGDPERADGWPWGEVGAWVEAGPVAAVTRVRSDAWYPDDPDGRDVGRRLGARSDEAYVTASLPLGPGAAGLFLGRMLRSWGPPGAGLPGAGDPGGAGGPARGPGLWLSANPQSYPALGLEVVAGPIAYRSLLGELDTIADSRRWLTAQQIELRATHDLWLAVGASAVWTGRGLGPGPRMLAPAGPFLWFDTDNPPTDRVDNIVMEAQAYWGGRDVALWSELTVDDFTYSDPFGGGSAAPPRYAFRAGAALPRLFDRGALLAQYAQVSSFAYRTQMHVDDYDYERRGLGSNFDDYDRLDLRLELYPPVPGLVIGPALHMLRQGEGSPRTPIPSLGANADSIFAYSPTLFLGRRTDTYRLAIDGRFDPVPFVFLSWDVGVNVVRNEEGVAGADATRFAGLISAGFRRDF